MNQNSRTVNVFKNIVGGVGGQLFTSLLQFVCRSVFISLLGAKYLGVNGLFSNILSLLSLAELGIGPAIVFSMYKPIAENDERHVARLMNFYKTAYRVVALVVAVIGVTLTPFLDFFIADGGDIKNLRLIFLLILSNTVVSYLYAYKGSMLSADQKAYAVVIIRNIFAVVQNIAQIIVLLLTGNFLLYLITQIITTLLGNFVQAKYVDKKYPFLVEYKSEKIDRDERRDIIKRVQGMMMHKVGGFVLNSTDNLVISKFVGVIAVGIYSNYLMIINMLKSFLSHITHALTASVGNLIASEDKQKVHNIFGTLQFVYFWIFSFCFISSWVIFQPFIELWIGSEYLLDRWTLLLVLLNFYLTGYQDCVNTFINATGLFWETRHKPIAECVINLGVSIALAYKFGIVGVFIGTLASFVCTFWINPVLLYKKYFDKGLFKYFMRFALYLTLTVAIAFALDFLITSFISVPLLWNVVIRFALCATVPNILIALIFCRTAGFEYCKNILLSLLKKILSRKAKS